MNGPDVVTVEYQNGREEHFERAEFHADPQPEGMVFVIERDGVPIATVPSHDVIAVYKQRYVVKKAGPSQAADSKGHSDGA